ncbi:XRE family transcriptional regulator [Thalassococcus sp. CAU 1522]|uniref:XRE family transcriptional regulator n=1 Tax=Thalassococcus arenae TaxID=2851652 RepID=A0ABS6N3M2_9RHOB|nr:XRE family transcriptional regulator [Thalassococcus arenae]MBV2358247.1 XRE family transcriptional regulator [Thalassococcus arenae]
MPRTVTHRLAEALAAMRSEKGWTLDQLAERSGVSRAALSRLEHAEVSPTADALARLCAAHGVRLSQLLARVEECYPALVGADEQNQWRDSDHPVTLRDMSPAGPGLSGCVQECRLGPGTATTLPVSAQPGAERHILMMQGQLTVSQGDETHEIARGDVLRFHENGPVALQAQGETGVRFFLFSVTG